MADQEESDTQICSSMTHLSDLEIPIEETKHSTTDQLTPTAFEDLHTKLDILLEIFGHLDDVTATAARG